MLCVPLSHRHNCACLQEYQGKARFAIIANSTEQASRCKHKLALLGAYVRVEHGVVADIEVDVISKLMTSLLTEARKGSQVLVTFLEAHESLMDVEFDLYADYNGPELYLQPFEQVRDYSLLRGQSLLRYRTSDIDL